MMMLMIFSGEDYFYPFFYDFGLWAYILCNNINYGLYFYEGIFGFHGIQSWGFTGVKD